MSNVSNLAVGTKVQIDTTEAKLQKIYGPIHTIGKFGVVTEVDDEISKGWPENHRVAVEGESVEWYYTPAMLKVVTEEQN